MVFRKCIANMIYFCKKKTNEKIINTHFKMNGFDNAINDFNKVFSNSLNQTNQNIENAKSFDAVFNSMGKNNVAPIQGNISQFVGMDAISATKIDNLSPTAKMAQDIGRGFKDGLKDLNTTTKEAEDAFETFASGGDISVHEVMIASQKSGLAMQMAIQLRNQMLNAYNEFKNMSI